MCITVVYQIVVMVDVSKSFTAVMYCLIPVWQQCNMERREILLPKIATDYPNKLLLCLARYTVLGAVLVYRYTGEFLLFSHPYMELWRSLLKFRSFVYRYTRTQPYPDTCYTTSLNICCREHPRMCLCFYLARPAHLTSAKYARGE